MKKVIGIIERVYTIYEEEFYSKESLIEKYKYILQYIGLVTPDIIKIRNKKLKKEIEKELLEIYINEISK